AQRLGRTSRELERHVALGPFESSRAQARRRVDDMSDGDNVTIDVSNLPNEVEVVCGEEGETDFCRTRVGVVKRTEVGMLFVPVQGPTFYLGPLGASARAQRTRS